jgi:hypothetical protein
MRSEVFAKNRSPCQTLATRQVNGRAELLNELRYFNVTARVAVPPLLLRTVIFTGFVAQLSKPFHLPLVSFVSAPIVAFVDVT